MGGCMWDQIELSERYLVSGMYDEAKCITCSVLKELLCGTQVEVVDYDYDLSESAGMVLVQALKGLGRTHDTFNELLHLFGSIAAIPIQVFLSGLCFQLSLAPFQDTRLLVEEYLSSWKFSDNQYYIPSASSHSNAISISSNFVLQVEEYLQVVEIYVVALLGVAMKDLDGAVSWVQNASLPEDKRQDLLTRLQSLYSLNSIGPSDGSIPSSPNESQPQSRQLVPRGSEEPSSAPFTPSGENNTKQSILNLSQQRVGCIWWFRSITLKLGNRRMAISNGKLVMTCLVVLVYFILKRKRILLKENLERRALSVRKGLVNLWELAFSYQVNPLAAVQPISSATRGSR